MTILIGGVQTNQHGVWEGRNTVCALFFYTLRSVIPFSCFEVRSGQINLCSFGNASLLK